MRPPVLSASRTRQAAVGLVIGLLLVGTLQLADPGVAADADSQPTDLHGPAADLAAAMDASEQTGHIEREVREGWNATTGSWGTPYDDYARMKYDPADRELVTAGFQPEPLGGDPRWVSYTTGDAQWTRLTASGAWELRRTDTTYADVTPFDTAALADASVARRVADDGTVRYDLHNQTAAVRTVVGEPFTDRGDPRVTVRVDPASGLVERVRIVRPPPTGEGLEPTRLTIYYESYGESVERPRGVPRVSGGLLLRDLLSGPVFSVS